MFRRRCSDRGQVIEEQQAGVTNAQYVWSPFYVNQLVERDDENDGSGNLTRRLYVEQDANFNVTSLTDSSGNVVERYVYDPYGTATVENADGTIRGDGTLASSEYGIEYLFQGGRIDPATGLYLFGARDYDPTTGRWDEQDPAGYIDGASRYQFVESNPTTALDPTGQFLTFYTITPTRVADGNIVTAVAAIGAEAVAAGWDIESTANDAYLQSYSQFGRPLPGYANRNSPPPGQQNPAALPKPQPASPAKKAPNLRKPSNTPSGQLSGAPCPKTQNGGAGQKPPNKPKGPAGFSDPNFGQKMHQMFQNALAALTGTDPGDWRMSTDPGMTGVDAKFIGDEADNPGYDHAELKPASQWSFDQFMNQLGNWNLTPGTTRLFLYDQAGNIFDSGYSY